MIRSDCIDLTNYKIGDIIVLKQTGIDKYHRRLWKCRCNCGYEFIRHGQSIRVSKRGHLCPKCKPKRFIIGEKIRGQTILNKDNNGFYTIKCDCGYIRTIEYRLDRARLCFKCIKCKVKSRGKPLTIEEAKAVQNLTQNRQWKERKIMIKELRNKGYKLRSIGDAMNVTRQRIIQLINED